MNPEGARVDKVAHIFLKDQELVKRLDQVARAEGRAKVEVVRRALERYFAEQEQRAE
jgi:predicted transcriptional regulator